jgi:uncharacterized protein YyaL (SSP411 family)
MAGKTINKTRYRRNNLDKSSSPYLLQHIANPVWWQEWSDEIISYSVKEKKLLFVSVGYATCHWCHVMASEAFSDHDIANYLNEHFICIKVDREQRPDIDQYLMDFINSQNGRGGWPLNVFMTPDLRPVYALTYAPVHTSDSMLSLREIAEKVKEYFDNNSEKIPPFVSFGDPPGSAEESSLAKTLSRYYDPENGGFGTGQKFPPHSSLLYLLYQAAIEDSPSIKTICLKTLDAMSLRGLNDHLQGGIFRYCVDREWTIPHFEKMLYDQAMALWCYSLAYRVTGRESYRIMAEKILMCLDECFKADGLYLTGHDADTEHEEGATYLWSYEEIRSLLSPDEFERFSKSYFIDKHGNFEGLIHLVRKNDDQLDDIEDKLLSVRKKRKQPTRDDKVVCGTNALTAIAMLQAGRNLGRPELEKGAEEIIRNLLGRFWDGKSLAHAYFGNAFQKQIFLADAAAVLTAMTMLYENDKSWSSLMADMTSYVESFKDGDKWIESGAADFHRVYASWLDHPIPSSVSLAEMGLARAALLTGKEINSISYREPFKSDFYNIAAMIINGQFHLFESKKELSWKLLPVNSLKMLGAHETDCYMGTCSPLEKGYYSG